MKKALRLLEAGLVLLLSLPLAVLPLKFALKAGETLGFLVFRLWQGRRKIAIENLRSVLSSHAIEVSVPAEDIIKENFGNLGKSLAEVIKLYFGSGRSVINSVTIDGEENFWAAKAKNRGILFITGHCGNWELLGIATSVRLGDLAPIVRPIDNPFLNSLVERVRGKFGNRVINKKGALKPVMRTLKNNGAVGILMDQAVLPEEGYVIDFLGRAAWATKMPALIARKTGAAVLPVFIHREGEGHKMRIYPAVELSQNDDMENAVKEDTARFSRFIEQFIKEHPSEWLWIHRRWKRANSQRTSSQLQ